MLRLRQITAAITMLAAFMLLFMLLCPYTPSPVAVCSVSGKLPGAQATPVVAMPHFSLAPTVLMVAERVTADVPRLPLPRPDLADLLCTRLC